MLLTDPKTLKKTILNSYDQVSIFAFYLNIFESDVEMCLGDKNNKINNPLRIDNNPSLGFRTIIDSETGIFKIRMWDYADNKYRGDCFDLVGIIKRLNSNYRDHFIIICYDIIYNQENIKNHNSPTKKLKEREFFINKITIEPRNLNSNDSSYWGKRLLDNIDLEQGKVFCVQTAYLNDEAIYVNNLSDPCYAYYLDTYKNTSLWKLYFPLRNKQQTRFLTNNNIYPIECIKEMKKADILLLTKARKEVLVIRKLLTYIQTDYSFQINSLTGESVILSDQYVDTLKSIYPYQLINTDADYTGITTANIYKRKFNWYRLVPRNMGGKDISDIVTKKGLKEGIKIVTEVYKNIVLYIKSKNNNNE